MILYEGDYSGILEPWRHYVPLAKNHSNMKEVVDVLLNPVAASEILENAYREIAMNDAYSYARFINHFDEVVDRSISVEMRRRCAPYDDAEFLLDTRSSMETLLKRARRGVREAAYRAIFGGVFRRMDHQRRQKLKLRARRFLRLLRARAK